MVGANKAYMDKMASNKKDADTPSKLGIDPNHKKRCTWTY